MKKFGIAAIVASGLTAGFMGIAAPAQADVTHKYWVDVIQPDVNVPHVDTSVHQSR